MNNRIISSIVIMLLLLGSNFAQNGNKETEIEAYKNKLAEYANDKEKNKMLSKSGDESFEEIKKIHFKAKQNDACKLKDEIIKEYINEMDKLKEKNLSRAEFNNITLSKHIQNDFFHFMQKNLSKNERKIFESDYVIIGEIINKKITTVVDGMISYDKITCEVVVKSIIMADSKIGINDSIKFSFGSHWYTKSEHIYEVGQNYLINLEFRVDLENGSGLHPIIYLDDNEGFYPVINNEIIDKTNSYGLGENITLKNLHNYYNDVIVELYGEDINE